MCCGSACGFRHRKPQHRCSLPLFAGIGVCAALALLDLPASEELPPLECLFTVDEETGLTGEARFTISKALARWTARNQSACCAYVTL